MQLEIHDDAEAAARAAATRLGEAVIAAVATRGRCAIALSGGRTPARMLEHLATADLPWASLHVFQADERVAPRDDAARNLTALEQRLVRDGPLPPAQLHAMPVDDADPARACAAYARGLAAAAGSPPRLDAAQLGLGEDGHTASLFPGDPALDARDDVAATGEHAGFRRMTLTLPALSRSRLLLWLVTGRAKAARLHDLAAGEGDAPSLRLPRGQAVIVCDAAAAAGISVSKP